MSSTGVNQRLFFFFVFFFRPLPVLQKFWQIKFSQILKIYKIIAQTKFQPDWQLGRGEKTAVDNYTVYDLYT